jgi:hypothetical protein
MGLFPSPSVRRGLVENGPAVTVKLSRWKRLFSKRRSTPSLSSAITRSFTELRNVSSVDNVRMTGRVLEVPLEDDLSDCDIRSNSSTNLSKRASTETLSQTIDRELFSDKTVFLNEVEDMENEISAGEFIVRPIHVETQSTEGGEIKKALEISVVAEVHNGTYLNQHS